AVLGSRPDIGLALWHGVNPPLFMSLAVIVIGMLLYSRRESLVKVLKAVPGRVNVNAIYDWAVDALVVYAERLTNRMFTGFTRDYFAWFQAFFVGLIVLGLAVGGGVSLRDLDLAP